MVRQRRSDHFLRQIKMLVTHFLRLKRLAVGCFLITAIFSILLLLGTPQAIAGLNDDKFDGNVFVLYGGNGSLVPARVTVAESLKREKPTLLVFYVDDSTDCKRYATVVSQLQEPYGRAANFIPVNIDTLPPKSAQPTEASYYYKGLVPQTVLLDQKGKVVLDQAGQLAFEEVDDAFRKVFDLLPRSKSLELKRRPVNEINTELTPDQH